LFSDLRYCIFISGPTASGKTGLSLELVKRVKKELGFGIQIVNIDVGQFYQPLSVGTAKPDWRSMPVKHHLFDILDEPKDLSVIDYNRMLLDTVEKIWSDGDLPVIVGGSLFYVRSVFFTPRVSLGTNGRRDGQALRSSKSEAGWEKLNEIDPERAKEIHPNDIYRIKRALAIWEETGKKPSESGPSFDPPFNSRIIFIDLDRKALYDRINKRTEEMIYHEGWVDEVRKLKGTDWEKFLKEKKLIGYPEIFAWIDEGEKKEELNALIGLIQQKTRNYAKRQITFWKKFRNLLEDSRDQLGNGLLCEAETINRVDNKEISRIIEHIANDKGKK